MMSEMILINETFFTSLLNDIEAAKFTIDLETYIYADDVFGYKVAIALCNAAKRGVKVRVLVDGVGTKDWGDELTLQMEREGVLTRVYHPLPWIIRHWKRSTKQYSSFIQKIIFLISRINSRNHRKTCIIDNKIIYVGSANIVSHHLRDTTVRFINADNTDLRYAFDRAWGKIYWRKKFQNFIKKIDLNAVIRLNYSWRRRRLLYKSLLKRIRNCKKRIWVTNAYFIPNIFLFRCLMHVSKKGVDVKILLPSQYDVFMFSFITRTFYTLLVNAGISIYEYSPRVLHAKSLILDDWFCVGSSNLNYRSFKHDLEIDVNIQTQGAKEILTQQFMTDINNSILINKDKIQNLSFYSKMLGQFFLLLKYWF